MKRSIETVMVVALAVLLAGCGDETQRPWGTLKKCKQANTELSMQMEKLQAENTQLTQQAATLASLDSKDRLAALDTLATIRLGKRTGFYDKDNNRIKETLVVYLEPVDTAQDYVKAVGSVRVELWDLNVPDDNAVAAWSLEPADLHTTWGGTIFQSYYRIKLPLEVPLNTGKEYTLKVTFTSYPVGTVLTAQKVMTVDH